MGNGKNVAERFRKKRKAGRNTMKKKRVWIKRCTALALSTVLAAASLMVNPGTALAETAAGTGMKTINDAIKDGETNIVLQADVTENVVIPKDKSVTIDLNGFTLTNNETSEKTHTITNNGTLTVVDNSAEKTGKVDNVTHARAALHNEVGATAILEGGEFTRSKENGQSAESFGGNSFYAIRNYGTLQIENGVKVTLDGKFSSLLENGWYDGKQNTEKASAVLTIEEGTFEGGLNTIKNDDWGVLTINGGTFNNVAQHAVMNWNEATITGGTFDCVEGDTAVINGRINDTMDKGILTIIGGIFNKKVSYNKGYETDAKITISGGTFAAAPESSMLAEGTSSVETTDGKTVVIPTEDLSVTVAGPEEPLGLKAAYNMTAKTYPENAKVTWTASPSNARVLTVSETGVVTAGTEEGEAVITASIKGTDVEDSWTVRVVKEKVALNGEIPMTLGVDSSKKLSVAYPTGKPAIFTSSNAEVATVDQNGTVTGKGMGKAVITASVENYEDASCEVKVVGNVELSDSELILKMGETEEETLTLVYPEDEDAEKAVWASSNENIVTVENGMVKAVAAGTANITVSIDGITEYGTDVCKVTVEKADEPEPVEKTLTLNASSIRMETKSSFQLKAEASPAAELTWKADSDVVSVDKNGLVTAGEKSGSAVVTVSARYEDGSVKSAGCEVLVSAEKGDAEGAETIVESELKDADQITLNTPAGLELSEEEKQKVAVEKIKQVEAAEAEILTNPEAAKEAGGLTDSVNTGALVKEGQNAVLSVGTTLKDMEMTVEKAADGSIVVRPSKVVFEASVFMDVYGEDGSLEKSHVELSNSDLNRHAAITFRLPVPSSVNGRYAQVKHISEDMGTSTISNCRIQNPGTASAYIELTVNHFSTFELTFTEDPVSTGGSGSSSSGGGRDYVDPSRWLKTGKWVQDSNGWWYKNADGTYPSNGWSCLIWNNKTQWYHFNAQGYMDTGWYLDTDGRWYFLHNVSDGNQGHMYTGWHEISGKWYYFHEAAGGPAGSLVTGGVTPDGYQVDSNGAWIQ